MNKEQFVAYMNKKLQVIKEEERKDIIDEYVNHIEMKVSEGKTEEEAIADFGDIDEMIKEILDAYNINPQSSQDSFDSKLNSFMDKLFDGFKNILSSVTSLDMDNIVKLLFEILVVLILLSLLRIPFEMLVSLGSSLLRSLFGYGIGSSMAWIWKLMVRLVYIVTFVVVLVNIFTKRVYRYRNHKMDAPIMDDFKESFNFEQAKEAVHRFTEGNKKAGTSHGDKGPYYDSDVHEEPSENTSSYHSEESSEQPYYGYKYHSSDKGENTIVRIILKIFGFLCMLPFVGLMIALCCMLGFMVILSFQGIVSVGLYFVVIGSIVGTNAVLSLLYRFLYKGGKV